MLIIAKTASISPLADIEDSVRGSRIELGEGVVVDAFVKIKPVGGIGDVCIGARSYINSGTVIYSGNGVRIGESVLIGPNCSLVPVNHAYLDKNTPVAKQGFLPSKGGIVIENDVTVNSNSVILDGSYLPTGVVIGAGSLVRGTLEPYGIYVGNPLKFIGRRE